LTDFPLKGTDSQDVNVFNVALLVSMMLMCKLSTTEHAFPIATKPVKFAIILEFFSG
jgi:hypothetical protein